MVAGKPKILLVDDETLYIDILVDLLKDDYSTVVANDVLRRNRSKSRRKRVKDEVDAVAAAVILQSYLDSRDEHRPPDVGRQADAPPTEVAW